MYTEHVHRSQLVRQNRRMLDKETKWEQRERRRTGRGLFYQVNENPTLEARTQTHLNAHAPGRGPHSPTPPTPSRIPLKPHQKSVTKPTSPFHPRQHGKKLCRFPPCTLIVQVTVPRSLSLLSLSLARSFCPRNMSASAIRVHTQDGAVPFIRNPKP